MKKILLSICLLSCCTMLKAQDSSHFVLKGYGLYDYHYATGSIGGAAATLSWIPRDARYTLSFGMEYVSSNRISANLQGEAVLLGSEQGKHLSLVNRYLWRQYPSLDIQEFTGALQLSGHLHHCNLALGLCNRYAASLVQRANGGRATVFEPMNVMFAIEGWWNDEVSEVAAPTWNAGFCWSNYNDFVIERVANWFFSLKGYYSLNEKVNLTAEAGIHPVGSLNLTASYDGWFCHLGGEYCF